MDEQTLGLIHEGIGWLCILIIGALICDYIVPVFMRWRFKKDMSVSQFNWIFTSGTDFVASRNERHYMATLNESLDDGTADSLPIQPCLCETCGQEVPPMLVRQAD